MSTTEEQPPAYAEDEVSEDEETDDWGEQPLTRRPRRRLLTPLTALLCAILVGAGGFIAGVQVEKGEVPATSSGGGGRLASLLSGAAGRSSVAGASGGSTTGGFSGAGGGVGAGGGGAGGGGGGAGGGGAGGGGAGGGGAGGGGAGGGGGGAGGGGAGGGGAGGGGGSAGATIGQVANISGSDLYVTELQGNTVKVAASAAQITKQVSTSVKGIHPGDTVIVAGTHLPNGSIQAATVRDSGSTGAGGGLGALFGGSGSGSGGSSGGTSNSPTSSATPSLFGK
jgi:hypothetical protein